MSHKPTLILVPGAWHGPSTWDKVSELLETQGFKCLAVDLPSTMSNPSATFGEDVEATRRLIAAEITQGTDVVVVVHSYGGIVGSSAIMGFTKESEVVSSMDARTSGHVIGLFMIATGFCQAGKSMLESFDGKPPPTWRLDPESGFATILVDPKQLFYQDLPSEEGDYWVSKLRKHSQRSLMEDGELVVEGWKEVPVWFLATTEDKAFGSSPAETQRLIVKMAKDAGANVTLREIESSHSPMLSKPNETVGFMLEAVADFLN